MKWLSLVIATSFFMACLSGDPQKDGDSYSNQEPSVDSIPSEDAVSSEDSISRNTETPEELEYQEVNEVVPSEEIDSDNIIISGSNESNALSDLQVTRQVLIKASGYGSPVVLRGKPVLIIADINDDGLRDACVLMVEADLSEEEKQSPIPYYLDPSSLYDDSKSVSRFSLAIFKQSQGSLLLVSVSELGYFKVFDDFQYFPVDLSTLDTMGIKCSFLTRKGKVDIIVSVPSEDGITLFNAEQNASSWYEYYDINMDGVIDLINYQRVLEDNLGFETYITWYKWSNREFILEGSINVLRNLSLFFDQLRQSMISDTGKDFLMNNLSEILPNLNIDNVCNFVFKNQDNEEFDPCLNVSNIVFPDIWENPFYIQNDGSGTTIVDIRIDYTTGESRFYSLSILLKANPFENGPFRFIPRD